MKLKFATPYKSIKSLPSIELPNFTVLTGPNGSGKTHLLQAIQNGAIQIEGIPSGSKPQSIRLFDWNNLVPNDEGAVDPHQLIQERNNFWRNLSTTINQNSPQVAKMLQQLGIPDHLRRDLRQLSEMKPEELSEIYDNLEKATQVLNQIQVALKQASTKIINAFQREKKHVNLLHLLQKSYPLPIITLTEEDYFQHYPITWTPVDPFTQSFARLFTAYEKMRVDNEFRAFRHMKGQDVTYLEEDEFLKRYGKPPWDFVNDILQKAGLNFRIENKPNGYQDVPYEANLIHQLNGERIKFGDLSSGERILMSFTLCLYYAQDARQIVEYPRVLLLDEVDAPLHPSMTQSMLNIVQETLVQEHKIHVILTTHSPSTVALSPDASIYVMKDDAQREIAKANRDHALAILTSGVPALSIDYENRRQVFVESRHDVEFYDRIYNRLRDKLIPEVSLNFISSGVRGQGNCDQVKEIVDRLVEFGNRYIYGIIDWDLHNEGNEHIAVLGKDRRYSIENYILDPLLVGAFLIREKFLDRSDIGMSENEIYSDLIEFDNVRLQRIVDFIVQKVQLQMSASKLDGDTECEYVGDQKVRIPIWYLRTKGHDLEMALKETFPPLRKYAPEPGLKLEIIKKVVDDLPQLISKDLIQTFSEVQKLQ